MPSCWARSISRCPPRPWCARGVWRPYRDLVGFCQPSIREGDYLDRIQDHFEDAIARVTESAAFWSWTRAPGHRPPVAEDPLGPTRAEALLNRQPHLAVLGRQVPAAAGPPLPIDLPLLDEMLEPMSVDDWLTLLEQFGLQVLKLSADPRERALYDELRAALVPFGVAITERGVRHTRSPGDYVLALSESKDRVVADILRAEAQALGDRLRAVVLTDFERISARARRLDGVLDPDAGSAVRLFQHLVADVSANALRPVMVTGKTVLVESSCQPAVEGALVRWSQSDGHVFSWSWRRTASPWMLQLEGSGRDWSPRTYVALFTELFAQGRHPLPGGHPRPPGRGVGRPRPQHAHRPHLGHHPHRRAADPRPEPAPRPCLAA